MSILCMMHVWWNSPTSGNDRLVLLAIADEADDDGRNAFPSVRRLADKVNCHTATVLRSVVNLERNGELEVVRPKVKAPGRGNKYRVVMQQVPTASEIRARYTEEPVEKTARKMQPAISTTARTVEKTARINDDNCARQVRADPKTPYIDPGAKSDDACGNQACMAGWVDNEDLTGVVPCGDCRSVMAGQL